MATISGEIRDENDDLLADCAVRAYRRDTGALLVAGLSGDGSPEEPGDADYASVALLLHCDGTDGSTTFTDHSPTPKTVTVYGNAHIETDQSKFGGASAAFVRTADYLQVSHETALELGAGDFTVEFWFNPTDASTNRAIWSGAADYHYAVALWNTNRMVFAASSTGSSWNIFTPDVGGTVWQGNNTVSVGAWHHYAVTRSGNIWRAFLDGVLDKEITVSATIVSRTEYFHVGRWNTNSELSFGGYLDELRITKGVARYTTNFTPPTAAFKDGVVIPAKPLGEYTLTTAYTGEVQVVALDPDGGTTFNDLILRTTPV